VKKDLDSLKNLWKTTPFRIAIVVLVLLVVGVGYYFASVPVKIGTEVICRYGDVISDSTYTLRVPKFLADRFKVNVEKSVCAKHAKSEKLYARAQRQIASKDYSGAKKNLNKVAKLDPDFRRAKSQLIAINRVTSSGGAPAGGGSSGSTGSTGGTSSSDETGAGGTSSGGSSGGGGTGENPPPVPIDLAALLPQGEISGYTRGTLLTNGNSAQVDFRPTPTTQTRSRSLLITVRQMNSVDAAKNFIDNTSKKAFPNDSKNLTVKGCAGYFGTNIYGYANLSWPNNVLIYEIQMLSTKATPLDLYDDIIKVTDYFP
jgi:hypothetical protein